MSVRGEERCECCTSYYTQQLYIPLLLRWPFCIDANHSSSLVVLVIINYDGGEEKKDKGYKRQNADEEASSPSKYVVYQRPVHNSLINVVQMAAHY